MSDKYVRYMTYLGRKRAREVLLNSNDRMLEDAGFSRALLEEGVGAWPWLTSEKDQSLEPIDFANPATLKAIEELQSYNDAELNDLGITRGTIVQAVLNGREGMDGSADRKAA
ncbi:MAG: hypothetical protein AB8B87_02895 [Granulosicoccus sp.]